MSQDLQVQGHENNVQEQQREVCEGKNATAAPACIGEGGRVGSRVKWKALSVRKDKALCNTKKTPRLSSALMHCQVVYRMLCLPSGPPGIPSVLMVIHPPSPRQTCGGNPSQGGPSVS